MNKNRTPKARHTGLVVQTFQNELLVYDTEVDKAHCLNETMVAVWNACDGKKTVTNIAEELGESPDTETNRRIVLLALNELKANNLMDAGFELDPNQQSRRDLIKKIGFASVVALPVIASLAAPSSTLAAASCGCVAPGDCLSQTTCLSTSNCNGSLCAP